LTIIAHTRGNIYTVVSWSDFPSNSNGKEKDYESGFHYYGARYYWSEILTGWLSVDPLADKYPDVSPYAYCMWNPVRLVDPDGREIWIVGDDRNTYQYKGGKLYTIDGTIYEGNDVFAMKVLGDLNTLIKNGMSEQINALEGSTKTHTIRRTSQSNETKPNNNNDIANGKGCNTTISYNPNLEKEEGWKRPPVVGLAHEMQHAFEMDAGEYNNTTVLCKKEAFMFTSVVVNNIPVCGNTICMDYGVVFYDVFREIEKGEYSAIQVANLVYRNLGGTKMRTRINGYTIDQLR